MDDSTAVVTGASRGLGAAVAREFGAAGAHVVACARAESRDALEAVANDVREAGGTATTQVADVRDEFDVERLLETAARESDGGVDVVVANAGVYHGDASETPVSEEPYAAFDDSLRTNVRGVFATFREAVPHLAPAARLLVPSGDVAREAAGGYGAYAVSKAGAEAVARQFAADPEVEAGIAVVHPGAVATDLTGGRGRDPEDVAPMFRWAATEAPDDDLDGGVLSLKEWKKATR
jgi:NAD(P)-dependent dehydrogenase (short-subunit alcohol dehydrogenase family)